MRRRISDFTLLEGSCAAVKLECSISQINNSKTPYKINKLKPPLPKKYLLTLRELASSSLLP